VLSGKVHVLVFYTLFIKPSLTAACNEVSGQCAASTTKDIAMSNDTVDMAEDTQKQLTEKVKKSKLFALQLDESTYIQKKSILLMYVDISTMMKVTRRKTF